MPDESSRVSPAGSSGPRTFVHDLCRAPTEMPADQVRGRLENPHGYNDWVYCAKCDGYVARRECRWQDTGENLGEFFDKAKAAVPPPPSTVGSALVLAVPIVLGGSVGYVWSGGSGALWGAVAGLVLGAIVLGLRSLGLR
jgi:hypothetical protein